MGSVIQFSTGSKEEAASPGEKEASDPGAAGASGQGMPLDAFEELLASCGTEIYALTVDADLVAAIGRIRGGQRAITIVEQWSGLAAAVDAGNCGIVLLDMDRVGTLLEKRLAELDRAIPPPVVVATASRSDAPELMDALMERRIHRLMIKPASPGKTRMLLEAAIHRSLQLRRPAGEPAAARGMGGFAGRWRVPIYAGAAVLLLGMIVGGGLLLRPVPPVELQPPAPALAAAPAAESAIELEGVQLIERPVPPPDPWAAELELARASFAAGQLAEPVEDNALDRYAAILAADPGHEGASAGLAAGVDVLFTLAESLLLANALELASSTLDHVRRVQPANPRLAFLSAQLERARAEEVRAQGAAEAEATTNELSRRLALAERRMAAGQLLGAAGDDAVTHFRRAAAVGGTDPGVVAMRGRLTAAIVASTRELLDAGEIVRSEALIAEARRLGADTAVLAGLEARLGEARGAQQREREAQWLELGHARMREGWLVAPASDSAAYYLARLRTENPTHPGLTEPWQALTAAIAGNFQASVASADWSGAESWLAGLAQIEADGVLIGSLTRELTVARTQAEFLRVAVPADELVLTTFRTPTYPEAALRNGTEGWVELEFIVGRDGQPRDVIVAEAEPPGAFDRAALAAVSRYRYEPYAQDGVVYERRARLRIRFALQ
jgi:periplasmic protein TonB